MRTLWVILFILGVAVVAVVDVDGDPTTSNVTAVVLVDGGVSTETRVDEAAIPERATPVRTVAAAPGKLIRRFVGIIQYLLGARARPIRGP
jgi:hypothetical protein